MTPAARTQLARDLYLAFADGDRELVESRLADGFTFSSPVDVGLDRGAHFERCWPGCGQRQQFEFVRLVEAADEVIVTYDMSADGGRGRNTEILTFNGDQIIGAEVYFGWYLQLTVQEGRVVEVVDWSRPELFEAFGLPMSLPPSHRSNRYEDEVNAKEVR